jgi:hypothetical protein
MLAVLAFHKIATPPASARDDIRRLSSRGGLSPTMRSHQKTFFLIEEISGEIATPSATARDD